MNLYRCGDARKADMSQSAVLWVNDQAWPDEVRRDIQSRIVNELPEESIAVLFKPVFPEFEKALFVKDRVTVEVSWM